MSLPIDRLSRGWALMPGMRRRWCVGAALLGLLLAPLAPTHADAMRCGSRVIRTGDPRSAVAAICGEPSDVQTTSVLRRQRLVVGGRIILGDDVEVPLEVWTYNFGPSKLLRRIRFVDGLVDEIETGGYGYREP